MFNAKGQTEINNTHQRSQTSYTFLCNGVLSHGAQFGGLQVFADHSCKNIRKANASMIFTCHAVFYVCFSVLSSLSDSSRCRHEHLMNCDYFDYEKKKLKTPNLSPCWDKDGAGSGITGLYLWYKLKIYQNGLKEYSQILTASFYDINQKILTRKSYYQNFSEFQFLVYQLCMIMCTGTAP